jgi:UDPglucose 6-dehydrogenase
LPRLAICDSALDAVAGADAVIVATEWPEFAGLDWRRVRAAVATPLLFDGRRLLDPDAMRGLGFRYERVGSPPSVAPVEVR